jgi:hypothetical protein
MGITDHVKGAVEGAVGALNSLAKGEAKRCGSPGPKRSST